MLGLVPVPIEVMKVFISGSAFSKCVPPEPSVAFWPVSSRLARVEAKVAIVLPVPKLLVSPTEQELLLPALEVHSHRMNGNNPIWN